jgi:DNA-directed RNA polymerase I subunit RPA43-like protein
METDMRHETQCVSIHTALLLAPLLTTTPHWVRGRSAVFALVLTSGNNTILAGRVTLCSPDHVSLLVHRTFNVSIPRHHIPTDQWEFEYGPAENDPEFGNVDDDLDDDATADVQGDDAHQRGRWVHKITGDRLGGKERRLHFTVVG